MKVALAKVMRYVSELRRFLPGARWRTDPLESRDPLSAPPSGGGGLSTRRGYLTRHQQALLQSWKNMEYEVMGLNKSTLIDLVAVYVTTEIGIVAWILTKLPLFD